MPIRMLSRGDRRFVEVDLQTAPLQLDLTALRSVLRDGQASHITGRDVTRAGVLAKAPRRRPIHVTIPPSMEADLDLAQGGHPLTTAIPCSMRGNVLKNTRYGSGSHVGGGDPVEFRNVKVYKALGQMELTDAGIAKYGDWPQEAVDQFNAGNPPQAIFEDHLPPLGNVREKEINFDTVDGRLRLGLGGPLGTSGTPAVNIPWDSPAGGDPDLVGFFGSTPFRWILAWSAHFNKRGIWVSNGQKFWLLQNGAYTQYLDLGESAGALGVTWRGAQISPNVFMFVHPQLPPRVITLDASPRSGAVNEVQATKYLGGLLAPDMGLNDFPPAQFDKASPASIVPDAQLSSGGSAGRVDAGVTGADAQYRVRLRVVDESTGSVSRMVDASAANKGIRDLDQVVHVPVGETDRVIYVLPHLAAISPISGFGTLLAALAGPNLFRIPLKSARATHVEFWRTSKAAVTFFRELRRQLAFPADSFFELSGSPGSFATDPLLSTQTGGFESGFNPAAGNHAALNLSDFELVRREDLSETDERAGGLPPTCRDIIAVSGCTLAGGSNTKPTILLLQGKRLVWPRITADGIIRHSEISGGNLIVYPESFHSDDFRTLTRNEDVFQAFAPSSDVVIAVYAKGAYRIIRLATQLAVKQLGESGVGTPWREAILPVGKVALWVSPTAIRIYNAEAEQGTGDFQSVEHGPMLQWFSDALAGGMRIDAGYDERYSTLHLRRSRVVETAANVAAGQSELSESDSLLNAVSALDEADIPVETALSAEDGGGVAAPTIIGAKTAYYLDSAAVYNLRTGDWTLIEDDNGFRYVAAEQIESGDPNLGPKLYTIDQLGGVFEENYKGASHPYDASVVQEVLTEARWTFTDAEIRSRNNAVNHFTTAMLGDVVRFKSARPEIEGLVRTIRVADAAKIQFDPLPAALQAGDEFIIGAMRFRVRFAPIVGSSQRTLKTLDQIEVYARPGKRHGGTGRINLRVYRDFGDTPRAGGTAEVSIFDDDDPAFTSDDRYVTASAQGRALEIELEDLNTLSDPVIDGVFCRAEEEGDLMDDAKTTS